MSILIAFFITALLWAYVHLYPSYAQTASDAKEIPLFGGLLKTVFWDQYEGIIITRNRKAQYTSDDVEGGSQLIYPLLGDQVQARIKLGSSQIRWHNKDRALTKDGLRVRIDMVVTWKVNDVNDYLFKINRAKPIGTPSDYNRYLIKEAEAWIQNQLEGIMRHLVRELKVVQLIHQDNEITNEYLDTAGKIKDIDELTHRIQTELKSEFYAYGIDIESIKILDIRFDDNIQKAIDAIKETQLNLSRSGMEGQATLARIQPLLDALGPDRYALMEALKNSNSGLLLGDAFPLMGNVTRGLTAETRQEVKELKGG